MAKVKKPCEKVLTEDVKETLNLMNAIKAGGTSGVMSELLKMCE